MLLPSFYYVLIMLRNKFEFGFKSYATVLWQAGNCAVEKRIEIGWKSIPTLTVVVAGQVVMDNDVTTHAVTWIDKLTA